MSLTNINPSITYEGNGVTTQWFFAMGIPDASAIQVFITDNLGEIRQLQPLEFQVIVAPLTGTNPTPQGGSVIYNPGGAPLPSGSFITIIRNIPPVQNVSLTNQSIIYPPVVEKEFDYLTMLAQQGGLTTDRSIKVPLADPLPADLPPKAERINQSAFFNDNGDLTAGLPLDDTVMVSAAMQPVVSATTTQEALALLGGYPDPKVINNGYPLVPDDNNRLLVAQGGLLYLISAGDPSTYPIDYRVQIVNNDTRVKVMNIFGYPVQFVLYPDQQCFVNRTPSGWVITRPGRWAPRTPQNFFVDPNLGSDDITVADGLTSGTGAFKTITNAVKVVEQNVDGDFTINLSNGTYSFNALAGLVLMRQLTGGPYKIIGNISDPSLVTLSIAATPYGTGGNLHYGDNSAITVRDGAAAVIQGITFVQSGTGFASALRATSSGTIYMEKCRFGLMYDAASGASSHLYASMGGCIIVTGNYNISDQTNWHAVVQYAGLVQFRNPNIVITIDKSLPNTNNILVFQNSSVTFWYALTYANPGFMNGYSVDAQYNSVVTTISGIGTVAGNTGTAIGSGSWAF